LPINGQCQPNISVHVGDIAFDIQKSGSVSRSAVRSTEPSLEMAISSLPSPMLQAVLPFTILEPVLVLRMDAHPLPLP